MVERVLTKRPQRGKRGANIDKRKHDAVRDAIVGLLRARRGMSSKTSLPTWRLAG